MTEFVHTWPKEWDRFVTANFDLMSRSRSSGSPWSGRQSVFGPHVQLWTASVQMSHEDAEAHAEIAAFFDEIGGRKGLIRMRHPIRQQPLIDSETQFSQERFSDNTSFSDGTGFVSGGLPSFIYAGSSADRGNKTMVVGGLPTSQARVLRMGDVFEVRRNGEENREPSFHRIARHAPTDADGKAGIKFNPGLRRAVAPGDQIVLRNATCVFRLVDDEQAQQNLTSPTFADLGFSLIEAIV